MAWYNSFLPTEDDGGLSWGRILPGLLAGAGTGWGIYGDYRAGKAQQSAYDYNRRQSEAYDLMAAKYMADQANYRNQMMGQMGGLMSQAMEAMNAPPISSYQPMSEATAKARRRGITAQQALRTGGNEGTLIDSLVAEGMAGDELERYKASAQIDALLNQNRMSLWPAMLSAFASSMGSLAPVAPLRPVGISMPSGGGGTGRGLDALGQFFKWDAERAERERQARQTIRYSPLPPSQTYTPPSLYNDNWQPDYPTVYGWT